MTASPLLPTSSHCEECRVAAEALEPRIAPAGFSATFLTTLPTLHGATLAVPDASLAALSATPQAPVVFSTEHAGVVLKDEVSIFATEAYKGTIESIAVRRTSTTDAVNLPIGGLDFYFQVALTSGAPNAEVSTVTLGLFAPYLVAAGIDGRSGPIASADPLNGKTGGGETPVLFSYSAGVGRYDFSAAQKRRRRVHECTMVPPQAGIERDVMIEQRRLTQERLDDEQSGEGFADDRALRCRAIALINLRNQLIAKELPKRR